MWPERILANHSLLAFADAVDRFDLRRPVMREEPILKIRKGFHPLHAMCVPSGQYIDNDTMLQGGGGENVAGMVGWGCVDWELTTDGRNWREWVWQVGLRQAGRSHHFYGPHWMLRPCRVRGDWYLRQE